MKVFIAGQKLFGASVLHLCHELGHEVTGATGPMMSGDRPDRLGMAAAEARVPWIAADLFTAEHVPAGTQVIVAAHAHQFIGRRTRHRALLGAIGYHPSLLPLHRGRDAIRWAIKLRERVTGGSIYWLGESIDGGDLAAQEHVLIREDDTPESLWRRELFPLGLRLIARVLADLAAGVIVRVPQDNAMATWEPALDRPPLFRPELSLLGSIDGYEVLRAASALG